MDWPTSIGNEMKAIRTVMLSPIASAGDPVPNVCKGGLQKKLKPESMLNAVDIWESMMVSGHATSTTASIICRDQWDTDITGTSSAPKRVITAIANSYTP